MLDNRNARATCGRENSSACFGHPKRCLHIRAEKKRLDGQQVRSVLFECLCGLLIDASESQLARAFRGLHTVAPYERWLRRITLHHRHAKTVVARVDSKHPHSSVLVLS